MDTSETDAGSRAPANEPFFIKRPVRYNIEDDAEFFQPGPRGRRAMIPNAGSGSNLTSRILAFPARSLLYYGRVLCSTLAS